MVVWTADIPSVEETYWEILHKGKRKEGPISIAQLRTIAVSSGMRIRRFGGSQWCAWVNAGEKYPELVLACIADGKSVDGQTFEADYNALRYLRR